MWEFLPGEDVVGPIWDGEAGEGSQHHYDGANARHAGRQEQGGGSQVLRSPVRKNPIRAAFKKKH